MLEAAAAKTGLPAVWLPRDSEPDPKVVECVVAWPGEPPLIADVVPSSRAWACGSRGTRAPGLWTSSTSWDGPGALETQRNCSAPRSQPCTAGRRNGTASTG